MSDDLPPIGHIVMKEGKAFTLMVHDPYVTKSGRNTIVLRFEGECRHPDCRERVRPALGANDFAKGKDIYPTACAEHKSWIGPDGRSRMTGPDFTPEQKAHWKKRQKEGFSAWLASLTPEQRRERGAKRRTTWKSLSPEQRASHIEKSKAANAARSPEDKAKHREKNSKGLKRYHASRTAEQKAAMSAKIKAGIAKRRTKQD